MRCISNYLYLSRGGVRDHKYRNIFRKWSQKAWLSNSFEFRAKRSQQLISQFSPNLSQHVDSCRESKAARRGWTLNVRSSRTPCWLASLPEVWFEEDWAVTPARWPGQRPHCFIGLRMSEFSHPVTWAPKSWMNLEKTTMMTRTRDPSSLDSMPCLQPGPVTNTFCWLFSIKNQCLTLYILRAGETPNFFNTAHKIL